MAKHPDLVHPVTGKRVTFRDYLRIIDGMPPEPPPTIRARRGRPDEGELVVIEGVYDSPELADWKAELRRRVIAELNAP